MGCQGEAGTVPGDAHLQFNICCVPFKGQAPRDMVLDEIVFAFSCRFPASGPLSLQESAFIFISETISVCQLKQLSPSFQRRREFCAGL